MSKVTYSCPVGYWPAIELPGKNGAINYLFLRPTVKEGEGAWTFTAGADVFVCFGSGRGDSAERHRFQGGAPVTDGRKPQSMPAFLLAELGFAPAAPAPAPAPVAAPAPAFVAAPVAAPAPAFVAAPVAAPAPAPAPAAEPAKRTRKTKTAAPKFLA